MELKGSIWLKEAESLVIPLMLLEISGHSICSEIMSSYGCSSS